MDPVSVPHLMKTFLRLLLPLLLLAPVTLAVDHEHKEKLKLAREVIELMEADAMIDGMTEQMMQNMAGQPGNPSGDQTALQDRIVKIAEEAAREMITEFDAIYAEIYTVEELEGIKAFFSSPAGQSMIKKQPELMGRIMPMVQRMQQNMLPKIQAAVAEFAPVPEPPPAPAMPEAPAEARAAAE